MYSKWNKCLKFHGMWGCLMFERAAASRSSYLFCIQSKDPCLDTTPFLGVLDMAAVSPAENRA